MRPVGLEHDEAGVRLGMDRGDQQVRRHRHRRPRLEGHEAPQGVVAGVDVVHLVEQGRAGDRFGAVDDDAADLALTVDVDEVQGPFESQGLCHHLMYQPQGWSLSKRVICLVCR